MVRVRQFRTRAVEHAAETKAAMPLKNLFTAPCASCSDLLYPGKRQRFYSPSPRWRLPKRLLQVRSRRITSARSGATSQVKVPRLALGPLWTSLTPSIWNRATEFYLRAGPSSLAPSTSAPKMAARPPPPLSSARMGGSRATIHAGEGSGLLFHNGGGFSVSELVIKGSGGASPSDHGIVFYNDAEGGAKLEHVRVDGVRVEGFNGHGLAVISTARGRGTGTSGSRTATSTRTGAASASTAPTVSVRR